MEASNRNQSPPQPKERALASFYSNVLNFTPCEECGEACVTRSQGQGFAIKGSLSAEGKASKSEDQQLHPAAHHALLQSSHPRSRYLT